MIKAIVFDLDGTIWEENNIVHGAVELINQLNSNGIPYAFLTNTTSHTPRYLSSKAKALGIQAYEDQIFTAVSHLELAIEKIDTDDTLFVVTGEDSVLFQQIAATGVSAIDLDTSKGEQLAEFSQHFSKVILISSFNRNFSYKHISKIFSIRNTLNEYWVVGNDRCYGAKGKKLIAASWITAAIEEVVSLNHKPFGKPNGETVKIVAESLGVKVEEVLLVGDSEYSDIGAASNAGALSCLVSSNSSIETKATYVVESLDKVVQIILDKVVQII